MTEIIIFGYIIFAFLFGYLVGHIHGQGRLLFFNSQEKKEAKGK